MPFLGKLGIPYTCGAVCCAGCCFSRVKVRRLCPAHAARRAGAARQGKALPSQASAGEASVGEAGFVGTARSGREAQAPKWSLKILAEIVNLSTKY